MDKLYNKTNWVDNTEPDINAANLNKIENGIDGLDNRAIAMDKRIDQVNSDLGSSYRANPLAVTIPNGNGPINITDAANVPAGYYIVIISSDAVLNYGVAYHTTNQDVLLGKGRNVVKFAYLEAGLYTIRASNYTGASVTTSSDGAYFGAHFIRLK